jgi:hypothetical protein
MHRRSLTTLFTLTCCTVAAAVLAPTSVADEPTLTEPVVIRSTYTTHQRSHGTPTIRRVEVGARHGVGLNLGYNDRNGLSIRYRSDHLDLGYHADRRYPRSYPEHHPRTIPRRGGCTVHGSHCRTVCTPRRRHTPRNTRPVIIINTNRADYGYSQPAGPVRVYTNPTQRRYYPPTPSGLPLTAGNSAADLTRPHRARPQVTTPPSYQPQFGNYIRLRDAATGQSRVIVAE